VTDTVDESSPRIACDAMCGGLARWLRALGVDTSYAPGIDDALLVQQAQAERRTVVSSDHKLFERRLFTSGELSGVLMPVGLPLNEQVHFVARHLKLTVGFPRCMLCNGTLAAVDRGEVADVVPARSLIWAREFFRCAACGHVYWDGTHWRRIQAVRAALAAGSQ
jgi:uncharacterized protein with PIN domain